MSEMYRHNQRKRDLLKTSTIAFSAALMFTLGAPPLASAQSANLTLFFNQANQMNNEEQDMAKELKSKAGDNQALVTMADTMRDDHKDDQTALEALASQKNVTLKSYEKNKAAEDQLDNLKGAQFNEAFLKMDIRDHEKALATFRRAKSELSSESAGTSLRRSDDSRARSAFEDGAKPPSCRQDLGKPGEPGQ